MHRIVSYRNGAVVCPADNAMWTRCLEESGTLARSIYRLSEDERLSGSTPMYRRLIQLPTIRNPDNDLLCDTLRDGKLQCPRKKELYLGTP